MTAAPVVVTVVIVTYNHARFISAAIDGVLSQKTSFQFEILISEDFSTDGTREIVQKYATAYPARLRVIYSERNVRSNEVVARGLRLARGRYVALLDGDDLWTSQSKLQNQVDYLDSHPKISAVFNNALVAEGDETTSRRWTRSDQMPLLTREMIWHGNPFATCAGMMRAAPVRNVPCWYADFFPITDWPLYVLCAKTGDIAYIDEIVGVYRIHAGGLVSSRPDQSRLDLIERFYRRMIALMPCPDSTYARGGYCRYFYDWSKQYFKNGDIPLARSSLLRCVRSGGAGLTVSRRDMLQLGLQLLKSMASR